MVCFTLFLKLKRFFQHILLLSLYSSEPSRSNIYFPGICLVSSLSTTNYETKICTYIIKASNWNNDWNRIPKLSKIFHITSAAVTNLHNAKNKVKVKLSHYRTLAGPWDSRGLRIPGFLGNRHMKVVRLSALRTGRLYPQESFLVLISVRG
jgi:hypothetical protein